MVPKLLTPPLVAGLATSVLLAVLGTLDAVRDPGGDRLWGGVLSVGGAAVLATVVGVLSAGFSRDGGLMPALRNLMLVPPTAGLLCAVAVTITVYFPPVHRQLEAAQATGSHYWFPARASLLGHSLGLTSLMGTLLSGAAGLVVVVVITLPVLALWRPAAVVGQNQLETSPEDAAINRRTARILAQLAFLVVAGPTCVILGSEQARANGLLEAFTNLDDFVALPGRYWADLIWVVGWLMLPLGLLVLARTIIWGRSLMTEVTPDVPLR